MYTTLNAKVHLSTQELISDVKSLENLLKKEIVSHPLGRRWTLQIALASTRDASKDASTDEKDSRLMLYWLPLDVSGDIQKPNGPWSRLTVWEVEFTTESGDRILWKKKVQQNGMENDNRARSCIILDSKMETV
jgi:hypothetical protein